ncbi:MAG: 30S ribosomal protein S17e [Candidatus Diapherotrites archaeon]|jgi:ribosomal protein S17E|nr:30S ribosomal protein S17e [Candidatus Diapherotrites archaeon]MBT4597188.1 30S ribosomal protein S17e [Candidatus Diapherotrites archaeon]
MGKSVSKGLKYRAEVLIAELPEKFSEDFDKNKDSLNEIELGLSKTNRNVLAGYLVRLAAKKE